MTTVYMAYATAAIKTLAKHSEDRAVDLLVSYVALKSFLRNRDKFNVRKWCIDSGAFSVWKSGAVVDFEEFNAAALDTDADEIFALDVVRNPAASQRNYERYLERGLTQFIPCFHEGSPWSYLTWIAERFDKIALGGIARRGEKARAEFAAQCFARVWPKKIHGFAACSWGMVRAAPFHSVDASSWTLAPLGYGAWAGYTGKQISLKQRGGGGFDVWGEVIEHQRRADYAAQLWRRELAMLEASEPQREMPA